VEPLDLLETSPACAVTSSPAQRVLQ